MPPEYLALKQVFSNDIEGDKPYKETSSGRKGKYKYENKGTLPKYNNYGAGSSDPGGFIVEGKNALGVGSYTQVRGDSAIGLATGEMTADLSEKDKSPYAKAMRQIMALEEKVYTGQELVDKAKEELEKARSNTPDNSAELEKSLTNAENKLTEYKEELATAKKEFRKNYLSGYSFVEGEAALGVGRQILAQGDRSMAVGDQAKAISNDAIAYGGNTLANGTNSMAMGGNAHVGTEGTEGTEGNSFNNSMAIGSHTNVQAGNAVALGAFSQVTGKNSLAIGFGKQSGETITYNNVSGEDSTLIGSYGTIKGNNSILIGSSGNIANDRVVGLGNNINIAEADPNDQENNTAGSVFLGDHAGYVKDSKRSRSLGQVDVVGSAGKMELTESLSSTKGALRDYTKDFIYIYMLERQDDGTQIGAPIAVRSDFAGGDSTVGVVSVGSTYEQNFNSLEDIKNYHTKVGSLITVPVEVTVQVTKNGVPLGEQKQIRYFAADSTYDEIYADNTLKDEDKAKVWKEIQTKTSTPNTTYTVFETRRIQNVAPGLIGVNSTDAINGSQLFATNQMLGNLVGSLKQTLGDSVTVTEDGQITVNGDIKTLGWIAKADTVAGSNGTVAYDADKKTDETEEAYRDRIAKLQEDGYIVDASKVMTFKAGKNIGLVQKPGELSISTIDMPSFKSVELRGETKNVDGKNVTEVTKIDSSGMKVVTETSTPASDGSTTPTVTEKVSTTVGKDGVSTDGSVKVTNGTTDLVTIDKGTDGSGTDQEYGKIGLDGKNGSNATITVDRGTSSLDDKKNIGTDPNQDISENNPAKMDRITYTTKNKGGNDVITHEVATMDDGLFFSGDSADGENNNVKNKFDRKLSQETKIIGGVNLGLTDNASAEDRKKAIAAKLTDGNIGVISDGTDTLTVKLAKQLTGLDSTTYTSPTTKTDDGDDATSTMKVDGNGVRFLDNKNQTKTDAPSLTTDGITGGNKTITDVASGIGGKVKDTDKNNANTFLENVNKIGKKDGDQPAADAISENVVVNAKDLKNLVDTGFKLNTSGQGNAGASTVKIGDTINVVDGANTKVSAITAEDGTHTFHIDVTGMPISYTDNQGNALTKIGDKFYKTEDLENGTPKPNKQPLTDNEVSNNISLLDKTGNTTAAPQIKNVGSGLVNSNNKAMNPSDLLNTADNDPVLKNAVNAGDLKQVAAAVKTEVTGTGKAIVTNTTAQDGHTIYNVHVDPVVNVVAADGKTQVVRGDDGKYYDPADIENKTFVPDGKGGGNWYNTSDIGDNGQPNTGASVQNINPVDVKNNFVNPNGTGSIVVDNVKSGIGGEVKDPAHNNKNTFIDNVNKVGKTTPDGTATPDAISENTVVNAKDLKNLVDTGFKLNTSGQPADPGATTVKIGETIKVVDGTNTKVSAITTSKDGVHAFHIDVTGMPISYTDTDGNALTKIGDNYYKNTDITNGVPNKDAVAVDPEKVTDNIKVINKDGSTTNPGTISNVKSAIEGTVGNGAPNGSTINSEGGTNTFIDNVNRIGADTNGIDKNSVVTTGDLKNLADTPLFFSGDAADGKEYNGATNTKNTFGRKLSEEAKIVGGVTAPANLTDNNIGVVSNGSDTLTIKLAKQLTGLDSATYTSPTTKVDDGDATSTMKVDGNGIRFVGDNNAVKTDAPSLTTDGIDGGNKQITNVGSGFKNGDKTISMSDLDDSEKWPNTNPIWNNAVNVGDLKKAKDAATTEVTGTGKAIVTKKTGDKGQNIYNVHVDPVVDVVDADGGNVVRGDDGKYYNPTDIADKTFVSDGKGGGSWYNNSDLTDGKPKPDAKPQTIKTANIKNKMVNPNGGDSIVLDNIKSGIGGEVVDPNKQNSNTFLENVNKVGDTISENTVVNAKDLKNVVDTGFKLNTSGQGKNPADTVKIGDTIQVVDGKNTTVSAITHPTTGVHEFHIDVTGLPVTYTATEGENGQPVDVSKVGDTYQLADGTKLVNYDGKFYKPNQIVNGQPVGDAQGFTINDDIRLVNPNNGTGPVKITNVAPGVGDNDAVNMSQLKTLSAGSKTEVTGTGAAEVTKVTGANGQNIYNVHVDKLMTVKPVDANSTIARGGDGKYYNAGDIAGKTFVSDGQGGGSWYDANDVDQATGKPKTEDDGITPKQPLADQPQAVDQNTLKNSVVNPNGNGPTVLDNVKSGIGGDAGNGIKNGSTIDGTTGNNTFIETLDKVGKPANEGGIDKTTVVNAGDLKNLADTPLFFSGDSADGVVAADGTDKNTFSRKLSQETKIVGGVNLELQDGATAEQRKEAIAAKLTDGNIGVISDGTDTLTIKLAKELKDLASVKVSNGKDGKEAKDLVTIGKEVDDKAPAGKDGENGFIGLDGKNGSEAVITINRGTKSITDEANLGEAPSQPVSGTNKSANMDRITYTTKGANGDINHEVATLDDGFMLTTSTDVANSKAPANVKLNNTIKFTDGANTKVSTVTSKDGVHELHVDVTGLPMTYTVSQTGDAGTSESVSKVGDTYQLADGTKLVKVDNKFYKPSQLVDSKADQPQVRPEEVAKDWTVNDSISLVNKDGSTNAPTLKNVGSGLKDANGNATTLDKAVGSNAVNVDDLRTMGKAATTEVKGTGAAEVTKVTGADGQNIYNVHVERFMQVAETDVEGNKVVKAADNHYYKEADIKDKTYIDGKWYNNTDIKDKTKIGDKWYNADDVVNGVPKPNATELTVQDTTPNKAVGLQNNLVNPNDNTPTRLSNLASALSGEVGNGANTEDNSAINGIDKNGKPTSESGNNTFVKNVLDLDATVKTEEQLKTSLGHDPSEDEVKAEKARAEKDKALLNSAVTVADLQKTLQSPLFFEGDSADGVANENGSDKNTFARKLSQKTKIVGGVDLGLKENATADERQKAIADKLTDGNIGVISDGTNTLTIKLAKNLVNLTSVETGSGDNKTKMTENGITTTVKDGDTFKVTTTTPNGLATTEVKLDSEDMPKGESTTTMVTTDGVTITTQTPPDPDGDKPASTTETKLSKDGLATDGTVKVTNGKTGDDAKDLVTIGKGTETDPNATDKEFGTVAIDGKNGSKATLTVDRGTKSVTDSANVGTDPTKPIDKDNPAAGMDRLTYTTTGIGDKTIEHQVATLDDGFFLTTEHTKADKTRTVLFNHTIKVLDGANTKVSAMGGEKGTHTFSIDVTGLPVTYTATKTDAKGAPTGEPVDVSKVGDGYQLADGTKLVKVDDKYYKPEQLENNKPKPGEEGLTIKQSVSLVQDNGAPATLERVGSGRRNGMDATADPMAWDKILNPSDADKAKVDDMLTNAANIGDVRDAIKSITNGTGDNATGGFGLTGNNGEVKQDLGKTITVKGGIANKVDEAGQDLHVPEKSTTDKNTYVNVKNNEMVVEIAKDLTDLDSVTIGNVDEKGNGGTVINKDGMTVKDATGNNSTSIGTGTIGTSKTDGNGNTSSTNIDGGTITSEKKDKDGNKQSTTIDGSHMTLENKDKDGKLTGPKTEVSNKGITITPVDEDGKPIEGKKVELSDKGLDNGGNQIKHVDSGLKDENGNSVKLKDATSDMLNNAVNVGDLKQAINSVTNSSNGGGFGLTGNNGKIMQNLGETITIKGGIANKKDDSGKDLPAKSTTDQNTYVNVKDSEMVVEIAKDLIDLDSVTIGNVDKKGNGGTVINKDGMTVKDATGNNSTSIGTGTIGTSKTDGNGNTSSTNIDGSTITLENKDKDGKLTGPKTEVSNKGITITPVDKDGKPIEGKKVKLSDKGLDNGGNQIKHVDSGLKKENGDSVKLEDAAGDMLNNAVNVGDLKSVNEKLKDDIINISNQVDDIKNSAPVVYVYTNEKGERKRVSKQGDKFVDEDGNPVKPHEIKLSLVNVDGKPSTLQNVAKGVQDTDAVNVKQLTDATEKPLTFNGDAGSSSAKLGETVAIKGGANSADLTDNNIGVIANSSTKTLNVKLSKKLKGLESAEFVDNNGNTTNITGDGVHISGGNGSNVSLTSQGLNNGGNRITNVAPGVEATDAVNVSQLNQVGAALHNRINNVAKGAYGGVASAGAMASLPQAYLPGKSMVAAGASHYRGESAVALGASRISDNGKIILKLNASHNTSGNTMVGAGVGYQF
ncbi:YadA-like family protein [Gallibacterium sp. ZY190522]